MSDDDILRDYQRALTADLCGWKRRAEAAESALKRERDELKAQSDERCAMGGPVRWDGHQRPTVCGSCVGDLLHELTEARQTIKTQGGWLDKTVSDRLVADTLRSDLAKCAHERDEARAERDAIRAKVQAWQDVAAYALGTAKENASGGCIDAAIANLDKLRLEIAEARAEVERLRAELSMADRVRLVSLMREDGFMEKRTAGEAWTAAAGKAEWLWAEVDRLSRAVVEASDMMLKKDAEVERLRGRIADYQSACEQKDEVVRGAVVENQALVACRAEVERLEAENAAHREAQAQVYLALEGDGANPDRATWPRTIRRLRDDAARYREALVLAERWLSGENADIEVTEELIERGCFTEAFVAAVREIRSALHPAGREQSKEVMPTVSIGRSESMDPPATPPAEVEQRAPVGVVRGYLPCRACGMPSGYAHADKCEVYEAERASITASKSTHNLCGPNGCDCPSRVGANGACIRCGHRQHVDGPCYGKPEPPKGEPEKDMCPHGRDPWDRCDECGVYSSLREALARYRERREAKPLPKIPVAIDPTMPPGTIEFRHPKTGEVLHTMTNVSAEPDPVAEARCDNWRFFRTNKCSLPGGHGGNCLFDSLPRDNDTVSEALREANRDHTSAANFSGQGEYQTWLALGHIIRAIEALAGRGK